MITNLTPHPVRVYGWDVPDVIDPAQHSPLHVFEPSGTVARIGEIELGTVYPRGCEVGVEYVEYRHVNGLPPPSRVEAGDYDGWFIVSLATALAAEDRGDLLVPWREIRNAEGTTVGCRQLARPV